MGLLLLSLSVLAAPAARAQEIAQRHGQWDELRLRTLGYRLARANAALCRGGPRLTGLMLHDIAGFAPEDRAAARRDHGLGTGFGVVALVAGGAAARAGLRAGDEIVAVNGRRMDGFETRLIGRAASYGRVEAFEDMLEAALAAAPAQIAVRRGESEFALALVADSGCSGRFVMLPDRSVNAWSNGRYVAVTSAMMARAQGDGALAFVIAHEMAHNLLGHNGATGAQAALLGGGRAPHDRELAADRLALTILREAGFDPGAAPALLRALAGRGEASASSTHPGIARRIAAIEAALTPR